MNQNFNDPRHPWSRLTTAARDVRDERDATPPYGFATRVAAIAFAQERRVASLFERFAFRAVGISCLLAVGSVVVNYNALTVPPAPAAAMAVVNSEPTPNDDAVAIVLGFAD